MTEEEYSRYCEQQGSTGVTHWANGIEYRLVPTPSGWVSVFMVEDGCYRTMIQAASMERAEGYCSLIEPVRVPITEL